jgi:putative endonuclease
MYVYLLRSLSHPNKTYVGLASNVRQRLEQHNAGESPHTSKYRPWQPVVTIQFGDAPRAAAFEAYLKSGSGHAFARRHFW